MTTPMALFGCLVAALLGAVFHLWRGGGIGRLLLYQVLAWTGFWLGQLAGGVIGITIGAVGGLNLVAALVGAAVLLFGGEFLSHIPQ